MKKKMLRMVSLVLVIAMVLPMTVFASPMDDVPQRERDGIVFVPLRQAAEAYNWTVKWESATRTVHLISPFGASDSMVMRDLLEMLNGFMDSGRIWIPLEFALLIFEVPEFRALYFPLDDDARALVLEDFDYLIHFILENTPWDSVIERALGIDFLAYALIFRDYIETADYYPLYILDEDAFDEELFRAQFPIHETDDARAQAANFLFAMLAFDFATNLMGIGHLGPRSLDLYTAQLTSFAREAYHLAVAGTENYWLSMILDAFTHPSAQWFYGEVEVDFYDDSNPLPEVPGNVVTAILSDDVAYLRINTFLADSDYDDVIIFPFLQSIADFSHLIIDVRSNFGGSSDYYPSLIMRRLINEPVEYSGHEFFSGGDVAVAVMDATLRNAMQQMEESDSIISIEIMTADAFIEAQGMDYFDPDDLERLEYVIIGRSLYEPAEDAVGFDGKVWLLVDGFSASASALAANIALNTGFATVVGENTSGIMGSTHVYTVLPNTGIIWRADIGYQTDADGRSLEVYGISPQIRNFEDMDALETVLMLIAIGDFE